jgi:putative transposase
MVTSATGRFKKNFGYPLRTPEQRYQRIDALKADYSITVLCQSFEVSTSGYYDWHRRQRQPANRAQEDLRLKEQIRSIHAQSRQTYGAPRVQVQLRSQGRCHGRNRIARLMREQGLCGRQKKRYRVVTTNSKHDQPIAPNRLAEMPLAETPNQIWVADITYVATAQGWVYVAAILDLYSRKIVGWAVSQQIDTALVLMALSMALTHRRPPAGLVFHSDRGVQYASGDYRQALAAARLVASMSRKGNCYDNATMEAFWSTLKLELIYRRQFEHASQLSQALFDYIEVFYNRQRLHSALGYRSPAEFECANN